MTGRVLIVGASARAAAESARRAGLAPMAMDSYCDADTREMADPALQYGCEDSYNQGLATIALTLPPAPWLYVGGLENRPDIVAELSAERELWGNGPEVLRLVRSPQWLAGVVSTVPGASFPESHFYGMPAPDGGWLWKPYGGSGGLRVCRAVPGRPPHLGCYRQRFVPGRLLSLVAVSHAAGATLIGVCEGLTAAPFRYAGTWGPLHLTADRRRLAEELVSAVDAACRAAGAPLAGAWNLDVIETADGYSVLELNPRVTAAVDVIDRSLGVSLVGLHAAACTSGAAPTLPAGPAQPWGKRIITAGRDLIAPPASEFTRLERELGAELRDRPWPGTTVSRRHPFCTLLVPGSREQLDIAAERFAAECHRWEVTHAHAE